VQAVSGFIATNGGNIIDSQQYSLGLDAHFFMRLVIESAGNFKQSPQELQETFKPIALRYDMDYSFERGQKRMAIMVSKYDHCLYDVLLKKQYQELDVEIPLIISNHPDLEPVAKMFKIPFAYLPITGDKRLQEKQVINLLQSLNIDFIAMARYMQILTPEFTSAYPHRIINVHHGFLPAFKGARPYHQAYDKGVKIIGATAHYATEDLDMGPIIEQDVIAVGHRDTVDDYIAKGRDIERMVFTKALRAHAEDKIISYQGRTIVFD
jgi:formyltetrahydrofolate deformylase